MIFRFFSEKSVFPCALTIIQLLDFFRILPLGTKVLNRILVQNDPVNFIDPWGLEIGDPPSKYPPGYDPGTWIPDSGDSFWDPDGNHWSPHPEDKGHWPHWDKQYPDGKRDRYPEKSKKPWTGQKKKPYGDQSAEDPNKAPECDDGCKRTITVGTMLFIIYNVCTGGAGG